MEKGLCALHEAAGEIEGQDKLPEAERLYQETITRWPNNVVAHNGLADVLRKQQRFNDALALLPEPANLVSRMPRSHYTCAV